MSKPHFNYSLFIVALTALLGGCFVGIDITPPEHTTNVKVEDSKGNVLYDGKGENVRLREEAIRTLPTDEVIITTTRSTTKEGQVVNETTTQTVKIKVGDIAGRGETDRVRWDAGSNSYVAKEVTQEPTEMTQIDAPSLSFVEQAPSRTPTHVKIQNGAGEVLTDGTPDDKGRVNARLDPAKFDGKLVITTTWNHGEDTVQTLTPEQGKPVGIGWDGQRYYLRPIDWRGKPTHITITDAKGNTFYDGQPHSADEPYPIANASGDKLFITTHWEHGDPTREEIAKPSTLKGPPTSVTWDQSVGGFIISNLPDSVTIKHGMGVAILGGTNPPGVQYTGPARPSGAYSVYPSRIHEPIHITTTFKDGTVVTQDLDYNDGDIDWDDWSDDEWVPFWWSPQTRRYELGYPPHRFLKYRNADETAPKLFGDIRLSGASVAIGASRVDLPGARIGVYPTPGDPTVLKGPTHLSGESLDLGFNLLKNGKPGSRWNIGLSWGDGRKSTEVAPGTSAGFLNWNQGSGSSLGLAGAGGWDATMKTSFSDYQVNWSNPKQIRSGPGYKVSFGPTLGLDYTKIDSDGSMVYQAVPDIYSRNAVKTQEWTVSAGFKIEATHRFAGKWLGSAGLGLGVDYTSANLNADQIVVCGVCAPPENDLKVHVKDDWGKFGLGATLNGSLSYSINRNATVSLLVDYRYKDKAVAVREKIGAEDDATHLGVDSREEWRVMAQFRHSY